MKNIIKILISLFFLSFLFTSNSISSEKTYGTRFIVAGHLYPITKDEKKLKNFADKVNKYNPDYIFILGDSGLHNKETFKKFKDLFKSKLFFAPGEQELKKSSENYKENVGYYDLLLEEKDVRFLILNSSSSAKDLKKNISQFLKEDFNQGPTVILTNHRIWDDTLLSKKPLQHDKSYYFAEIYPLIKNKVKYIFAGNGKRQYFRDIEDDVSYGKQNVNVIYWLDKIGSIEAYAVGMGDGNPKAIFTIVDVVEKKLFVRGDYSTTQNYEILPKKLISADKHKINNKYSRDNYIFINKKKFYISSLGLIIFVGFIFFYKKKLNKQKNK